MLDISIIEKNLPKRSLFQSFKSVKDFLTLSVCWLRIEIVAGPFFNVLSVPQLFNDSYSALALNKDHDNSLVEREKTICTHTVKTRERRSGDVRK